MTHPEVDGEGAVAVLREDPAEAIALIVLEDEDLIPLRVPQRTRVSQVDAIRHAAPDHEPGRWRQRIGLVAEGRRDLDVGPGHALDDAVDGSGDRAGERAA